MSKSRIIYGLAAIAVFAVEVLIALFVHDQIIRPYVGDILAVVLVYLGLRVVTPWNATAALLAALLIAVLIEFGQYFHLLDLLGLSRNRIARVVLGGAFDLKDFVCYAVGGALVLAAETLRKAR
ncbi:MAG TPA: DUF2809 domain-containing protein [Asticcacaulis sp.]|nr:DUF2809 domain-containing protein [Asticcacaulis sp.]